jgi:hypothetical protein
MDKDWIIEQILPTDSTLPEEWKYKLLTPESLSRQTIRLYCQMKERGLHCIA